MSIEQLTAMSFDRFAVGDRVVFTQRFRDEDFAAFSLLSGDSNPLHGDDDYARGSEFGRRIVPLHLTMAPLSRIAGMHFPGEPSLYVSHTARAVAPVYFGDRISYSARITAVAEATRMLTIPVLATRQTEVVLQAELQVRSRLAEWPTDPARRREVVPTSAPRTVLVTGAAGGIGGAVVRCFARLGWNIVAQHRGGPERIAAQLAECARVAPAARATSVAADLQSEADIDRLVAVAREQDVSVVVHAASPRIDAGQGPLFAVNHGALKRIVAGLLPGALLHQRGAFVLVGSAAQLTHPRGWEDYVGAKAAAASLLDRVEKEYAAYGVRGLTVAPGLVRTAFSEGIQRATEPRLLPEEVAECIAATVMAPDAAPFTLVLPDRTEQGQVGFRARNAPPTLIRSEVVPTIQQADRGSNVDVPQGDLASVVRAALRLSGTTDLASAALGITPGWDSLTHIGLLLAVERAFRISVAAADFERTKTMADLLALVRAKTSH